MIGQINIPAAHVRAPIMRNISEASLARGAGHYPSTCWFGQKRCTVALAGHDVTFVPTAEGGHTFGGLAINYEHHRSMKGKKIYVRYHKRNFVYRILYQIVIPPTRVRVLRYKASFERLVLTTCYPRYSAAKRLVTVAKRIR